MAKFNDTADREWTIELDAPKIEKLRNEIPGVDLADIQGKTIQLLVDDPCTLVNTLWFLCAKQAAKMEPTVTAEMFGEGLVGDAIDRATDALCEAIVFFSPSSKRKLLEAIFKKAEEVQEMGTEAALKKINDPELSKKIVKAIEDDMDEQIRTKLLNLSPSPTSAPDSAESIPTD